LQGGHDPFDGRLANLTDPRSRTVLERLRTFSSDLTMDRAEDRSWGIGLARYKGTGGWAAVMAEVVLADDIRVPRVRVVADIGEVTHPDETTN
jgi:nicotinate dehydrogenase subunit B